MTREQIEARIVFMQERLARARHPEDIAACNRILEQLILMDGDDERELPNSREGRDHPARR